MSPPPPPQTGPPSPPPPHLARMIMYKGAKYGAIAGLIATWSISTAIAASELELGLPISTFYSIMGIALGSDNAITAAYLGFGLHLITGALLGTVIGSVTTRWKKLSMFNPYRGTVIGIAAGLVIWLILFMPITALLIQPSIQRIVTVLAIESQHPILSDNVNQSIRGIAISAIVFHIVWGAIFGFIMSSILRIRASRSNIWSNILKERKGQGE